MTTYIQIIALWTIAVCATYLICKWITSNLDPKKKELPTLKGYRNGPHSLDSEINFCKDCANAMNPDLEFCPECGYDQGCGYGDLPRAS